MMRNCGGLIFVIKCQNFVSFRSGIFLFLVCFLLLVVRAQEPLKEIDWYVVEPWEVDVCRAWGGREVPLQGVVEQGVSALGDVTMTVQARRVRTFADESLYEVGYYLDSVGVVSGYSVELVDQGSQAVKVLASGSLAPGSGFADLFVAYLNESFSHVRIVHDRGVMLAKVVDVR